MPLNYPQFSDLANLIRAEFRNQLPNVDPTVFGSWARAFGDGNAALAQEISYLIRDLEKQMFPQTATDEYLDRWGDYEDLPRKSDSTASGRITLGGVATTVIPSGSTMRGSNGINYVSSSAATINAVSQAIVTLTRSGSTVTAELATDHALATGIDVTISGVTEPEYNGTFTASVGARDSFTYEISTTPTTPATGSPVYGADIADVPVVSIETGIQANLDSGASVAIDPLITGADDSGLVQFSGIAGGAGIESNNDYRARIILSRSIISGVFTSDQVKLAALSIAGNTRAFVKIPTTSGSGGYLDPIPGQTSVFFLRDDDTPITPTTPIIALTKAAVIEEGAMPAHTAESDVFVNAPTLVPTDFGFTSLSPDTTTMRSAVEAQLSAFFEDSADFEESITEASYLGSIQNTQDLVTGEFLTSFSLSTPTGDIIVSDGEIASLGNVTFA